MAMATQYLQHPALENNPGNRIIRRLASQPWILGSYGSHHSSTMGGLDYPGIPE